MLRPTLTQLPPPPPGKSGWPWTEECPPVADETSGWPKISIVTPSYNQGAYIEETIRSVLLQGYPDLEYFIMDGGSTDDTVAVIKKYEPWLAGWVSQKDGGQPDAINCGWKRSTGQVLAWLNSDDWYCPNALREIGMAFKNNPETHWVCGEVYNCWSASRIVKRHKPGCPSVAECLGRKNYGFHQPGMFWSRKFIDEVGHLDDTLQYSFCHDFWMRALLKHFKPTNLEKPIAYFRLHNSSKTVSSKHRFCQQDWVIFNRYADKLNATELRQARKWLKEYEADTLLDALYGLLAEGKKNEARQLLANRLSLLPKIKPLKVVPGLLYRTLVTGAAPQWFRI